MRIRIHKSFDPGTVNQVVVSVEVDAELSQKVPKEIADATGDELYATCIERMRLEVEKFDELKLKLRVPT